MARDRLTDADVIAAIRATHRKANIDPCDCEPARWGTPMWSQACVDSGGTIFGDGPYLHVPIEGGAWDGTVQRVYAPARLRRRLARQWAAPVSAPCGTVTTMGRALSETYARDPGFYGATFCVRCNAHFPVAEFVWTADGQPVGS